MYEKSQNLDYTSQILFLHNKQKESQKSCSSFSPLSVYFTVSSSSPDMVTSSASPGVLFLFDSWSELSLPPSENLLGDKLC